MEGEGGLQTELNETHPGCDLYEEDEGGGSGGEGEGEGDGVPILAHLDDIEAEMGEND